MIGLDSFSLADTTTIEICDAHGSRLLFPTKDTIGDEEPERAPFTVTVRRLSSREGQKYRHQLQNQKLKAIHRTGKTSAGAKSAEVLDEEAVDLLVFLIQDWDNLLYEGEHRPYSDDLARKLLTNPTLVFFREQVDRAAGDDTLFSGNS